MPLYSILKPAPSSNSAVDEALSVGDVFFQAKCYHKFEEFKEMGKTIVFVSHDLSSISKLIVKANIGAGQSCSNTTFIRIV